MMSAETPGLCGKRIIVGLTGGIACYKIADVVSTLVQQGAYVDVLMTEASTRFISPLTFESLTGNPVFDNQWSHIEGRLPQHIQLATVCDAMLIAPCTMDMLAKLVYGRTDDPVSLVSSAIDRTVTPVLLAPSMNAIMYSQPSNQRNLTLARSDGYVLIDPEEGWQACRADGMGRLPDSSTLLGALEGVLL